MSLFGWFRRHWSGPNHGSAPRTLATLESGADRGGRETPIMVNEAWRCFLGKKYLDDLSHYLQNNPWPRTEWAARARAGQDPAPGEPGETLGHEAIQDR